MKTLTELTARLLDASESMTRYLHDHTEELARGEEPHVFTATNAYAELQEATVDLRHAIELGEALNSSPFPKCCTNELPYAGAKVLVWLPRWEVPKVLEFNTQPELRFICRESGKWWWRPHEMYWAPINYPSPIYNAEIPY